MNKQKKVPNQQYTFTVEGNTEKLYLEWLQRLINSNSHISNCTVTFNISIAQNVFSYAKRRTPTNNMSIYHVVDIEGSDKENQDKFKTTLDDMKNVEKQKTVSYKLAYSNLAFELWLILHKRELNTKFTKHSQYLMEINNTFHCDFKNFQEYKNELNFKIFLDQLTLDDVKNAVRNEKTIMRINAENECKSIEHRGYKYYLCCQSCTVGTMIEEILKQCKLLD